MTDQFYTNLEIWEKLTDKIDGLSKELTKTQQLVSAYNGLRERVSEAEAKADAACAALETIRAEGSGKNKLVSGIFLAIGIIGALVGIAGSILAIASKL